ncbi:hypothetical protein GOODEAATRI_028227 [Goodea atripinnis]|uniref:Uncharacterized protein n=1 Tax=Goodea atripinnis TaxID=208336 RepID=A0ABV0NE76_9TELE
MLCVMSEEEGVISKLFPHGLSKISLYTKAFRDPFSETKDPRSAPENQPHSIMRPPPNLTLVTIKSDKYRSPGNCQTQTCLSDCQMEKGNSILYTCGHGIDWNTSFQLFGRVSKYFWQYSVFHHLNIKLGLQKVVISCVAQFNNTCEPDVVLS